MPTDIKHFINKIICGDAYRVLKQFPDESIDCVISSPPYWALRDYGVEGQLGLEASFYEYIDKLCDVFDEVKRVLKQTGTCWVNIGDTYSSKGRWSPYLQLKSYQQESDTLKAKRPDSDLPGKCLLEIPARFAIEMISRGWILRNEIIWYVRHEAR